MFIKRTRQIEVVRQFGLSRFVYFADPERQQPLYYWAEPREAVHASPLDRDVVHLPLARHGTAAGRAINPNTIRVRTASTIKGMHARVRNGRLGQA